MASLRDLGLSEYECRVYRSLLRAGTATAKELSRASGVPMGRIYDVLNALEAEGLLRSQSASSPKRYAAVEPGTALDRLLAERKRTLAERARQYEAVVEELSGELERADPVGEEFWTAAVGPEEAIDLLLERLAAADERIEMVVGEPAAGLDVAEVGPTVTDELEAAFDRGVSVRVLATRDLIDRLPEGVYDRYADRLADRAGFEVRTTDGAATAFNVIDEVEVCIEVPNPLDTERTLAMIDLKDRAFAADVRGVLDPRWREAEPLRG